jgi:YVTN family beta-propeller protein
MIRCAPLVRGEVRNRLERMRTSALPRLAGSTLLLAGALAFLAPFVPQPAPGGEQAASSPECVTFSPDGAQVAVTDSSGGRLWLTSLETLEARSVALHGAPQGVAWASQGQLFVAEFGASSVAEIDADRGLVRRRAEVGRYPCGLALAEGRGFLLVANGFSHTVSVLDLASLTELARIPVVREPRFLAVAADESVAVVSNFLPAGRATAADYAASVSLLDLTTLGERRDVHLPPGSSSVRGVAASRAGRWAYVVHTLGRTAVPTTQIEHGWINTNALSIIDVAAGSLYATLLLDHPLEGAADPWGVVSSPDGASLWITLSGVHQLVRIDLERLHDHLEGGLPADHALAGDHQPGAGSEDIWRRIRRDPRARAELANHLAAPYAAGLLERRDLDACGPRGLAVDAGANHLAIASHFTAELLLLDLRDDDTQTRVPLGPRPDPDPAQLGRRLFHDASLCFQHWLSCATCHPAGARVDGLNWDNLNDGVGNPKNAKSLLFADRTPPLMWRGVRADLQVATHKSFHFLQRVARPGELEAMQAYTRSLVPLPSPHLRADGSLTAAATRGRRLFESSATGCADCHPGPLFTDRKPYDVGSRGALDHADSFDTPSLIELYRTGPYLHDGSAASLREVLTIRNAQDRHGVTSQLDSAELEDLIAYLMSL